MGLAERAARVGVAAIDVVAAPGFAEDIFFADMILRAPVEEGGSELSLGAFGVFGLEGVSEATLAGFLGVFLPFFVDGSSQSS